jgi:hypothetical protein
VRSRSERPQDPGKVVDRMQDESPSSEAMRCLRCKRPFIGEEPAASISGSIMGDEYTDSYFLCPACQVYTVVCWRDNFTGLETVNRAGPLEKQAGDELIAVIRKCDRPWDKKCRCEWHRAYFRGALD